MTADSVCFAVQCIFHYLLQISGAQPTVFDSAHII